MNKVILFGRVGKAPEMRYTPGGAAVTNFSIATDFRSKGADGEARNETTWHDCVAWGKTAEIIAEHVTQGQQLALEGRIQKRSWEGQDGQKRWRTEVVVERFDFGAKPNGRGNQQHQEAEAVPVGVQDVDPDEIPF